jgi:hypothetical protein
MNVTQKNENDEKNIYRHYFSADSVPPLEGMDEWLSFSIAIDALTGNCTLSRKGERSVALWALCVTWRKFGVILHKEPQSKTTLFLQIFHPAQDALYFTSHFLQKRTLNVRNPYTNRLIVYRFLPNKNRT